MSANEIRRRPVSVGGASLFAVLIIVCLLIFAFLARLTAKSELNLSEKAARSVSMYYEAERRAVEQVAAAAGALPIGETKTFTESIDDNRELRITFRVTKNGVVYDEWAVVVKSEESEQDNFGNAGNMSDFGSLPF